MNAVEITAPGPPEVLRLGRRPVPRPKAGEALIRVSAAGVNYPDVLQRQGRYPPPPGASDIPGLEVAGEVVAVGEGTPRDCVGERVCALVSGGGYAEYCAAPAPQCLPVPKGLDDVAAAAVPETFFTVWANVFDRGSLKSGETLLVHGGSGGVGTTAIQLGRTFGARVFATAGSAEKCAACESLGAERAIDHRREDFVAVVRDLTGGRGVDVILDVLGGEELPRNIECLAVDGRLLQIAFLKGPKAEIDLTPILHRRLTLTGSTLRPRPVEEKGTIAWALKGSVWPMLEHGTVRPLVHKTFPLAQAADAHRLMESRGHVGKIVLTI
ncbi:MAG TPA: NAD(P)H-quinone oxidoreductase [Vicinamibacteria bacterium]